MSLPLVLLRPQPGNDASAARARELGLDVVQVPLFETLAVEPPPLPAGPFDALLLTSANGVRFGRNVLAAFAPLPLYAVGTATAQAAREAGHQHILTGDGDAASTVPLIVRDGHIHVLHLCGADVRPFDSLSLQIVRYIAYRAAERAESVVRPPLDKLGVAVAAIHSPRAGALFASLITPARRSAIRIAAMSPASAAACGTGWAEISISATPDDTALLACAERLCIRAG